MMRPRLGVCLALGLGLLYLGAELYLFERPAFPLDDSWIHLQFARQLAAGDGLAYNAGERVNGSTAPLWTALVSLGFLLPGGLPLLWPKLLGLLFLGLSVSACGIWARTLGLGAWGRRMAEVMVACSHWWIWSALSGMEILLFSTLCLWGMIHHQREADEPDRPPLSLAFFAAACLARPEGLLVLAIALGERCLDAFNSQDAARLLAGRLLQGSALVAVILLPTVAYYQWSGGSPLPTTFQAKTPGDGSLLPRADYLWKVLHVFWGSQPILTLLALGGGVGLVRGRASGRPLRLLPLLWLVGQPLAYAVISSERGPQPLGNFGRYYFPLLPVVVVLGLLALEPLRDADLRLGRLRLRASAWLAILLLAPQALPLWHGPGRYLQTVANVEDSDVRAALWLRDRLPPGARIGAQDIGAVKFFLPNHYLVDLAGIIHPEVRRLLHRSLADDAETYWEADLAEHLQRERVDYLVLFRRSYPGLTQPGSGFEVVQSFAVENNVTMAGHELVVLKTPWSGAPDLAEPN